MKPKTLVVGGQESFIQSKWKAHLKKYGLGIGWHWNYEKRRFPDFPKSATSVILIKDMCSHAARTLAIDGARKRDIPYAEVSRQWERAVPILKMQGIINNPTEDFMNLNIDDLREYLEIIIMEEQSTEIGIIAPKIRALMTPIEVSDQILKTEINRYVLKTQKPQENKMKKTYPELSTALQQRVDQALKDIGNWDTPHYYRVGVLLQQAASWSIKKKRSKNDPKLPVNRQTRRQLQRWKSMPSEFNAICTKTCQVLDLKVTPYIFNKAYTAISGSKQSGYNARQVGDYMGFNFDEDFDFRKLEAAKPKEEDAQSKPSIEEVQQKVDPPSLATPKDSVPLSIPTGVEKEIESLRSLVATLSQDLKALTLSHADALKEKQRMAEDIIQINDLLTNGLELHSNQMQNSISELTSSLKDDLKTQNDRHRNVVLGLSERVEVLEKAPVGSTPTDDKISITVSKDTFLSLIMGNKLNITLG